MESTNQENGFDFRVGEHVALIEDDWGLVGQDLILIDAEPVPGSTQCVIQAGRETRYVSRGALRHL